MALADQILSLLGDNPDNYAEQDRWLAVFSIFLTDGPKVLPWILGVLPLLWLGWRRLKHKQIMRRHVVWAAILIVILALLGYFGPVLLQGLLAWISFGGGFYINL